MRIRVRLAAVAIVLAAACAAFVAPTRAAEYTLKWAVVTRGDMQEKFGHKLAEILPKATNGRVEVKVFPGGQLGSPGGHDRRPATRHHRRLRKSGRLLRRRRSALRRVQHSVPVQRAPTQANKVLADPEFNAYRAEDGGSQGASSASISRSRPSRFTSAPRSRCASLTTSRA